MRGRTVSRSASRINSSVGRFYGLEVVEALLPAPIDFDTHLDASEDHFLPALEIYTELNYVSVIDGKRLRFDARRAESDMIEKSSRGALYVFDIPLSALTPKLAVSSTDNF